MDKDNAADSVVVRLNDGTLAVRDVSSLSEFKVSPTLVGSLTIGSTSVSVYVSGRYAYVVDQNSNDLKVIDVSGGEYTSVIAHSLEAGNLQVRNDIIAQGQLQVTGGLNVGTGGIFSDGDVGIDGDVTISGGIRINDVVAFRKYMIGDTTRGGIVFWIDETGEHGLVCALSDQSFSEDWGPFPVGTAAIRDNIYGGMMNTERIITTQGANNYPADLCAQHNGDGYGDWYLPAKEELNLIWQNLYRFGCPNVAPDASPCPTALGGFSPDNYWSSTESSVVNAWQQDFTDGRQSESQKSGNNRVRAIRRF